MTKRAWLAIGVAGAIIVAVLLLVAQDQRTLRVHTAMAAGDSRFVDGIAVLLGVPVTEGSFRVLLNGAETFPPMLQAIADADRRIAFETYIYSEGAIPDAFTEALAAAAGRGVNVRLVLDAVGAADLAASGRQQLERAGAHLLWYNELRPWTLESVNYRTHRKLLITDDTLAYTGGIGIADHWRGNASGPDEWRDTQFEVRGPVVRLLQGAFYDNWLEAGGVEAPALDPPPPAPVDALPCIVVWSGAVGGESRIKRLFLLSIAAARRTLDIQSPYVVLDESSMWALEQARARGVRIRMLTESEQTDAKPVKYAGRAGYQRLLDLGIDIYEYQPTMMHAKVMVVDESWSVVGSANFDNRSLELNDELMLGIAGRPLAVRLIRDFETDLERSTRIRAEEWRERPVMERLREWFWSAFGEIF